MNLRIIERSLKPFLLRLECAWNRLVGREFIPAAVDVFHIETTSTCNLKCKFCAYEKKSSPRLSMSQEAFVDVVGQAIELGFGRFELTPCTGDIFMDKQAFEKFAFLEQHPRVVDYSFFSNLSVPGEHQLLRLATLKKLKHLTISVYGHDESSFLAITGATRNVYQRFIANLEAVLAHQADWPFEISIGHRSSLDAVSPAASALMALLQRYRAAGVPVNESHGIYNNWGGYVTQADVAGLNMSIVAANAALKSGACVKLFDSVQVMASGIVNACSCRDVDATLAIGHIESAPLARIISARNADYRKIIDEQQQGKFRPACASCDYYRSIYHQPKNYRKDGTPTQTMAQYFAKLGREEAGAG